MEEEMIRRKKQMKEVFDLFDENHDGSIDIKELGDGFRGLGGNPTDAEVRILMQKADSQVNPNGRIEFNEFYNLMANHMKSREEEHHSLMEAFRCFDKNGDGFIDKNELRTALKNVGLGQMTDGEVNELFSQADRDGSGRIDYRELVAVLTNSNN